MMIKICGVKTTPIARAALKAGAHFIGIVFYSQSKRGVDVDLAQILTKTILEAGGEPVGVFMDASAAEIKQVCEATGIRVIQLHGEKTIVESEVLPDYYRRIYALTPALNHEVITVQRPERDFLLFDALQPGSGRPFDWKNFHYSGSYRWFLSGGLTVNNVMKGIQALTPFGVDVSSGVENEKGEKRIQKIQAFVRAATSCSQ